MSLVFNGTDVTAVTFNGSTVQTIVYNGVTVWNATLQWSGSSLVEFSTGNYWGIQTLGNAYWYRLDGTGYSGSNLYATLSGLGTGSSLIYPSGTIMGFSSTSSSLTWVESDTPVYGTVSYDLSSRFTGSTLAVYTIPFGDTIYWGFITSGGLLAMTSSAYGTGAWISLT